MLGLFRRKKSPSQEFVDGAHRNLDMLGRFSGYLSRFSKSGRADAASGVASVIHGIEAGGFFSQPVSSLWDLEPVWASLSYEEAKAIDTMLRNCVMMPGSPSEPWDLGHSVCTLWIRYTFFRYSRSIQLPGGSEVAAVVAAVHDKCREVLTEIVEVPSIDKRMRGSPMALE